MMPQKRNPDAAELVRSKSGMIIGSLTSLLIVMKALPLAYSKDMQEDKVPVFETSDTIEICLAVISGMIRDIKINKTRMLESAKDNFSVATDLADFLVREKNIPFRDSHHIVGSIVKLAEKNGCELSEISLNDIKKVDERLDLETIESLNVKTSVNSKISYGGTSPKSVKFQIAEAKKRL
jgi:argininosuccinate lyase